MQRVRAIIYDQNNILLGLNHSNQYMLPGGKIHETEHTVDALIREVWEETGIKNFLKLHYLWECEGNKVFLYVPAAECTPNLDYDPDLEFKDLQWFDYREIPYSETNPYALSILNKFIGENIVQNVTEVWCGQEKVLAVLEDSTRPVETQQNSAGPGESPSLYPGHENPVCVGCGLPSDFQSENLEARGSGNFERSLQMKIVYDLIDELLTTYIPEEQNRPSAEIVNKVDYLGKTNWRQHEGGDDKTHIEVNQKIVNNEHLLRQVLAHEIIHHHLFQKYGNRVADHGELFLKFADRINAKEGKDFVTEFADKTKFRSQEET